jgi:hypothetical protein
VAGSGRKNADEALALGLATGLTTADAALAAGVGERTARRRLADAVFRRRVAELRGEMVGRALGKVADGMAEAGDVLRTLLAANVPPAVRLGACRTILALGVRLREVVELEARLAALEAFMTAKGAP